MNRTDRLYAIAEELRRVGPRGTTSARLARLFEVTTRTVKRDVSALQQAGLAVVAQAGAGGGYVLVGATLPPVALTPAQAVALALAVDALPPGSPFGVDARTARDKVLDAMPAADRARAVALSERVWTRSDADATSRPAAAAGPTAGTRAPDGARAPDGLATTARAGADRDAAGTPAAVVAVAAPGVLRAVEDALSRERVLAIEYTGVAGATSQRRVEPIVLTRTHGRWYLAAWCRTRDDVRWFRLDRVRRADVTAEPYEARPVAVVGEPPDDARPVGRRPHDG
ncbi:WYL domain-containing protein [Cellulomonas fimi]|uniref:helix-turn-helix transcriptional regulator n=1 Tax=Cellulomonas fimi TaxID=1708 RepID=UPI00234D6228|nr:WYL domain-containing protein [Cellulomonas fimi]MDC7122550.1 WYL domain-containing protein [Cellulomonas fimi]